MTMPRRTARLAALAVVVLVADQASHSRSSLAERLEVRAIHATELADDHLARGLAFYEAREFEQAIAEFHAGYQVDPRPELLFALAQAERRSGDCASALIYYQRFLATHPPLQQVRAANRQRASCLAALRSGPAHGKQRSSDRTRSLAGDSPASLSSQKGQAPAPGSGPVVVMLHSPWYHDALADILIGSSATSIVVGIGFLSASRSAREDASVAATYPEHAMQIGRAERYRDWGLVGLASGAALASVAVIRLATRQSRRWLESPLGETSTLSITPSRGGFTIGYGGRF